MKVILAISLTIVVMLFSAIAYTAPGAIYCAVQNESHGVPPHLIRKAKTRIADHLSDISSDPLVLGFSAVSEIEPFQLNSYGSTHFLPWRTCVVIGPDGMNIDVVAHELVHAEVAFRMGYINRALALPVWFDEGLAMQVDFRPEYELENRDASVSPPPDSWDTAAEFYQVSDQQLTLNYATARFEVDQWLKTRQPGCVLNELTSIESKQLFNALWNDAERCTKPAVHAPD